jgi:hypothetical protein
MSSDTKPQAFTDGHESALRAVIAFLAWGSWAAAIAIFAWATFTYNPNEGEFAPQWVGFSFILAIGVGIAAGSARARHKLSDTILAAFQAGLLAQQQHAAELTAKVRADMQTIDDNNNHHNGHA